MGILQARILEWVAMPSSRGIFPTQESNWDLLHCRQILYQLSYQGSHLESRVMLIPRNESCFGAMSMGIGFG